MLYKENIDLCFQSKLADKLSAELQKLMIVCQKNLYYTKKLQKQAHNKGVKPQNYASGKKIWLNSKYIKTKRNRKLEENFFGPFWVLYLVGK